MAQETGSQGGRRRPDRGAVLVTGASSGIGKACAKRLAEGGFRVFAGLAHPDHAADIADLEHLGFEPVVIDVTDDASVAAAAAYVERALGGDRLVGLLNNAGIGIAWPVELVPIDQLQLQFDVNVFGQVRVTQAMLPMLRAARGRVVTIGSIGTHITMPFAGALAGSKAAVTTLMEALRMELRPWGVDVVVIEPASIHTAAVDALERALEPTVDRFGPTGRALYERSYRTMIGKAVARERAGSPPSVVAERVFTAFTAPRPKTRYLVGADARRLRMLSRLPDRLLDGLRLRVLGLPTRATTSVGQDSAVSTS